MGEFFEFVSLSRPATPISDPAPLLLQLETRLNFIVTYKGEQRMLQGIADYSLWYSQSEPLATNLVIIEAKGPGAICQADPQVAAYMGKQSTTSQGYVGSDADDYKGWCTESERRRRK